MSPICPTHGVDHNDPAELEKQLRKYKRRLILCTALYLGAVALTWYGLFALLGFGGLAVGVGLFFIHFGQINMRLNGGVLEEIKADQRQREHFAMGLNPNAGPAEHAGKGNYL